MISKVENILYGPSLQSLLNGKAATLASRGLIEIIKDFQGINLNHIIVCVLGRIAQNDIEIITILSEYVIAKNLKQKKQVLCRVVQNISNFCEEQHYEYYDGLEVEIKNQEQL